MNETFEIGEPCLVVSRHGRGTQFAIVVDSSPFDLRDHDYAVEVPGFRSGLGGCIWMAYRWQLRKLPRLETDSRAEETANV